MYFIIITAVNMFEPGEGEEVCFDKLVKLTNFGVFLDFGYFFTEF